ncbi:MAG: lysophospholipid acyltransferase family protein, partial [Thermodesulfobacteriota bacterium]
FSVNRENFRQGMRDLQKAAEYLDQGESLLVFPEGTRSEDGKLQDFYTGVFIIALKSKNARIVPLVMDGTRQILPKGKIGLGRGRDVYITGRTPVEVRKEYGLKERERLKEDMHKLMQQMYSEIGEWKKQKRN